MLNHCFNILNGIDMSPNIRYQTSVILAGLGKHEITSLLTTFLTKITLEEFLKISYMAMINIEKTEEFLKSNIKTEGVNNVFRDFLIQKNKEVLLTNRLTSCNFFSSSKCSNWI